MSGDRNPIDIVLVDDHALFREGVRELLKLDEDFAVVGEAGDSESAVETVLRLRPHVVLLDVEIPGAEVTATVRRLSEHTPETKVIILSVHDNPALLKALLAENIHGYLLKSVAVDELVAAVRRVRRSDDQVSLSVSRETLAVLFSADANRGSLSDREREVLQLAVQALSNFQIGTRLSLTEPTVKRHLSNIYLKLGAVSRIDAVNKAVAAGIIEPNNQGTRAPH